MSVSVMLPLVIVLLKDMFCLLEALDPDRPNMTKDIKIRIKMRIVRSFSGKEIKDRLVVLLFSIIVCVPRLS